MRRIVLEIWKFRALLFALIGRHLTARYRGSLLGFVWSFLNPLCLIAVYSLVFQYYIRFDSVEHYTLFLFAGLLPWIWFSSGLLEATASISSGGSLITKALFPAHILPLVSVFTNLMHFLFAIPLLVGFMLISGLVPNASFLALPFVVLIEALFLVGLSLALSALNVRFRDVQHILGNIITLWFFLCPILYPIENVPEAFRFTMLFNPVAQFTEMYQSIFIDRTFPSISMMLITLILSCGVCVLGARVFNHYRDEFAELI